MSQMGVKKYINDNYDGKEKAELIEIYQKNEGILSGNFYHWENEFKNLAYEKQLEMSLTSFINSKLEQVKADAKKIRDEELAKEEAEKVKEEEAWQDGKNTGF